MAEDWEDLRIWTQPIELVIPLHRALTLHVALCLSLRTKIAPKGTEEILRRLGALLVVRGGLTREQLAEAERAEGLAPTDVDAELVRQRMIATQLEPGVSSV